ncbi:PTS sugar transporter subunit IIA [Brassicibacter mesophilus]|jgi:sugar PTS system EIIA component|uniref:PTS sugar transporter subunit IIA n=1 Tax=Brassicibacter mesophilus TaxID=745119 RepID=UPI003D1903CB
MLNIFKKNSVIDIISPLTGEAIDISQVSDQVFSQKMLGDGIAIDPTDGNVVSPCNGKVIQVFPTNHAIGIETKEGIEILIHLGLDTVELKGKGFKRLVNEGDKVKTGDKLIEMDMAYLKDNAKSLITPVVITNGDKVESMEKLLGNVVHGESLVMKINRK